MSVLPWMSPPSSSFSSSTSSSVRCRRRRQQHSGIFIVVGVIVVVVVFVDVVVFVVVVFFVIGIAGARRRRRRRKRVRPERANVLSTSSSLLYRLRPGRPPPESVVYPRPGRPSQPTQHALRPAGGAYGQQTGAGQRQRVHGGCSWRSSSACRGSQRCFSACCVGALAAGAQLRQLPEGE